MPEMIALCGAAKFRPVRDPDAYVRRVSRALGSDLSITPTLRGDGRSRVERRGHRCRRCEPADDHHLALTTDRYVPPAGVEWHSRSQ
jgi:hypothetical protein